MEFFEKLVEILSPPLVQENYNSNKDDVLLSELKKEQNQKVPLKKT